MTVAPEPHVAIVQSCVPHYRKPFFDNIRERLADKGIRLNLFYGRPYGEGAAKKAAVHVPWAVEAPTRLLRVGGRHLTWQCCLKRLQSMELVICEQASSQLLLYALWARYLARGQRLALWGHGRNFQAGRASRIGEDVKRALSTRVHWWFAYNELSADVVHRLGFPRERITDVQNTIDTTELRTAAQRVSDAQLSELRTALGLQDGHVGLYAGSMYREKRIGYLIEACVALRRLVPDFQMVFLGAGPDEGLVAEAAARHPWMHYVGPQFGTARVPYFLLADLHLMPGLVGLTLLDSFTLETPLVTLDGSDHSPEIAYLRNGDNGVMLPAATTPERYAHAVAGLLLDEPARRRLRQGCAASSADFTVEAMSARFVDGVLAALDAPVIRTRARATDAQDDPSDWSAVPVGALTGW